MRCMVEAFEHITSLNGAKSFVSLPCPYVDILNSPINILYLICGFELFIISQLDDKSSGKVYLKKRGCDRFYYLWATGTPSLASALGVWEFVAFRYEIMLQTLCWSYSYSYSFVVTIL